MVPGVAFDRTGARLIGDGEPLARALAKLEQGAKAIPMNVDLAQSSKYIVNPLTGRRVQFANLFSTHPPLEERIARPAESRATVSATQVVPGERLHRVTWRRPGASTRSVSASEKASGARSTGRPAGSRMVVVTRGAVAVDEQDPIGHLRDRRLEMEATVHIGDTKRVALGVDLFDPAQNDATIGRGV